MGWGNEPSYQFSRTSILLNAPQEPGIYVLQADTTWIYVGETENIRAQLVAHLDGDNLCITMHSTLRFSYELVPSVIRTWRRDDLIKAYRPTCNQL